MSVDAVAVLLRAGSFIASFQCAGALLFTTVFGHRLDRSRVAIQRMTWRCAIAAMVLVSLHYALEAARMGGDWSSVFDGELQSLVWSGPQASVWLIRLLSLALITAAAFLRARTAVLLGTAGAVLLSFSFTLVGHVSQAAVPLLRAVLAAHLMAVAFWFGSLQPLIMVVRREEAAHAALIVQSFSRGAAWVVAVLLVAGVLLLTALLPGWSALLMPYGQRMLLKVAGFALLMGLAALNKWRYAPLLAVQQAESRQGATRSRAHRVFQRTVLLEYFAICGVLLVTAWLTTFFSPESQ